MIFSWLFNSVPRTATQRKIGKLSTINFLLFEYCLSAGEERSQMFYMKIANRHFHLAFVFCLRPAIYKFMFIFMLVQGEQRVCNSGTVESVNLERRDADFFMFLGRVWSALYIGTCEVTS